MATNINTILSWFKTGQKPTQSQFWSSWQSFWHKDELIPQNSIDNLSNTFETKVDQSKFDDHKIDTAAHNALFEAKENKNQKGISGGYAPLNNFTKLASQYLDIVNDLVTGGSSSLLSAEQGKILHNQINSINTLLKSDNANLGTFQAIVNAIEETQILLSTILINDLTTGGATKALTAEMGRTLKNQLTNLDTATLHKTGDEIKAGKLTVSAIIKSGGTAQQALLADGSVLDQPIAGTGTSNKISKWTTGGKQTDSLLSDSGNDIVYQNATYPASSTTDRSAFLFNQSGSNGSGIGAIKQTFNTSDLILYSQYGYNNSTEVARFKATGNVGIGTTLPTEKLDVNGNIKGTSLIIPKGSITTATQEGAIERDSNGKLWTTRNGKKYKLIEDDGSIISLIANFPPKTYSDTPAAITTSYTLVLGSIGIGEIANIFAGRIGLIFNTYWTESGGGSVMPTSIKVEYFLRITNGTYDSYIWGVNPSGTDLLIYSYDILSDTTHLSVFYKNQSFPVYSKIGNTGVNGNYNGIGVQNTFRNTRKADNSNNQNVSECSFQIVKKVTHTYADATNVNGNNRQVNVSIETNTCYMEKIR